MKNFEDNTFENDNIENNNIEAQKEAEGYSTLEASALSEAEGYSTLEASAPEISSSKDEVISEAPDKKELEDTNGEAPLHSSNIKINPIKSVKKNKSRAYKVASIVAAAAVFGVSVGTGLGFGFNTSKEIIEKEFSFDNSSLGAQDYTFEINENSSLPEASSMSLAYYNGVTQIVKQIKDTVVNISVTSQQTNFFNQIFESSGSGSGIIYKQDDTKVYIVTNNHVVDGATKVTISITGEEQVNAMLVGKDTQSDLAVISVLKSDLAAAGINSVTVAEFADSDKIEVGEFVLAIGNALGQGKTVTQGIISAQNKTVNIDGKKLTVLQTDAAINPGNSGGALVNSEGKVIGINTAKLSSSSVEGTGYAIPSSVVQALVPELIEKGTIARPYLGIVGFTINDSFRSMYGINASGVFVRSVSAGSSAERAGLVVSDIITSINGTTITSIEELSDFIINCKVGDTINISILRNGNQPMTLTTTLTDLNNK